MPRPPYSQEPPTRARLSGDYSRALSKCLLTGRSSNRTIRLYCRTPIVAKKWNESEVAESQFRRVRVRRSRLRRLRPHRPHRPGCFMMVIALSLVLSFPKPPTPATSGP